MKIGFIFAVLLVLVTISDSSFAQKRKPARKPSAKNYDLYLFVIPVDVRVGYHRMRDPAVFIKLKNLGSRLKIKSVNCTVLVTDSIRLNIITNYDINFEFALPVNPGEIGEAVATKSEVPRLDEDITPARCKDFMASEGFAPKVAFEPKVY